MAGTNNLPQTIAYYEMLQRVSDFEGLLGSGQGLVVGACKLSLDFCFPINDILPYEINDYLLTKHLARFKGKGKVVPVLK
jgi:hypothetical protein